MLLSHYNISTTEKKKTSMKIVVVSGPGRKLLMEFIVKTWAHSMEWRRDKRHELFQGLYYRKYAVTVSAHLKVVFSSGHHPLMG